MQLNFKKLHPNAILPVYATDGAAGMDLHARIDESEVIHPGESAVVPTGLAVDLPDMTQAEIRGRSGLAFKHGIFGFVGTIDNDYRDELKVLITNYSKVPFEIKPDMRIGQLVVNAAVVRCRPQFVDIISSSKREGGFGSTGLEQISKKPDSQYAGPQGMYDSAPDHEEIKNNLLNVK